MKRKIWSFILCLSMIVTLIPTSLVSAAEKDIIQINIDDKSQIADDFQGLVAQMSEYTFSDETKGIQISVGLWNTKLFTMTSIRFYADPSKVALCDKDGLEADQINEDSLFFDNIPASLIEESASSTDKTNLPKRALNSSYGIFDTAPQFTSDLANGKIGIDAGVRNGGSSAGKLIGYNGTTFTYGTKDILPVYNFYYKPVSGNLDDIDFTTFALWSDEDGNVTAGAKTTDGQSNIVDSGAYFIGFPKEKEKTYEVSLVARNHGDTEYVSGATVVLDGDAPNHTYTTNATGQLLKDNTVVSSFQLTKGVHTYTIVPGSEDKTNAANMEGTFEVVDSAGVQSFKLQTKEKIAQSFDFTIKVLNGDDANKPIQNAEIIWDGSVSSKPQTDANGEVTLNKAENTVPYSLKVEAAGFGPANGSVKIIPDQNGTMEVQATGGTAAQDITVDNAAHTITVILYKGRVNITVPVKDSTDEPIVKGNIVIDADLNGTVPDTIKSQLPIKYPISAGTATFSLPAGAYLYKIEASGYETTAPASLFVQDDKVTVNGTVTNNAVTGGAAVTVTAGAATVGENVLPKPSAISEPLYVVEGAWTEATEEKPSQFKVMVSLDNIDATTGTFGLRYDANLFSLSKADGVVYNSSTIMVPTDLVTDTVNLKNPEIGEGYHLFNWKGLEVGSSVTPVNAKTNGKTLLATYTFDLNKDKDGNPLDITKLMNNESIFVKAFTDTANYKALEAAYPGQDNQPIFDMAVSDYWRSIGKADATEAGRLTNDKALAGGFYQVFPVNDDGGADPYDIRSQFVFDSYSNIRVEYTVVDEADLPVSDATITIFDEKGYEVNEAGELQNVVMTAQTDADGKVYVSLPKDKTYHYYVNKEGFWPYPGNTIEAEANKTIEMVVAAETVKNDITIMAKAYHPVGLSTGTAERAELSGEDRAYNNVDYYFTLNPKAGYAWGEGGKPASITDIVIQDANDSNAEVATVTATFVPSRNQYKIVGNAIVGAAIGPDAGEGMDPLMAGLIEIDIPDIASLVVERDYTITATAGDGGTVTSEPAIGSDASITGDSTQIVQTVSGPGKDSAKFTFTAKKDDGGKNYVIDQVIINGVAFNTQQGNDTCEYTFTGVGADQNITVTFAERTVDPDTGEETDTPASDPVISVIVGEYGTVTIPGAPDGIILTGDTARDFTGTAGTAFTATVSPIAPVTVGEDTITYEIDKVLVNGAAQNVTDRQSYSLSITPEANTNYTVVVTFKTQDGESMQAIVTAGVGQGMGSIAPAGVSIYNIGDTPAYTVKEAEQWKPGDVLVGENKVELSNGVYKFPKLDGDKTITANFDEVTYFVQVTVNFNNGSPTGHITPKNPAEVIFERPADGKKLSFQTGTPMADQASVKAEVPEGTWNVTVRKSGYLDYVITGFAIDTTKGLTADAPIYFGAASGVTEAKPVVPIIGDASRDGLLISLRDVAQVANGMVSGASAASMTKADVDESDYNPTSHTSTAVTAADMVYVKTNFGKRYKIETYDIFKNN